MEMGFAEFLQWLIFGGGSILCSSWLLERWAWFQAQTSKMREFVSFASAALLSLGAYALVTFGADLVLTLEPFFTILAIIFSSVFLKNIFHKYDKKDEAKG